MRDATARYMFNRIMCVNFRFASFIYIIRPRFAECIDLVNEEDCTRFDSLSCAWENANQQCETDLAGMGQCSDLPNEDDCIGFDSLPCLWESVDQKCYQKGV